MPRGLKRFLFWLNPTEAMHHGHIAFRLQTKDVSSDGVIDLELLLSHHEIDWEEHTIRVDWGPKIFKFWLVERDNRKDVELLDWFTTESVLYEKWRGNPAITGLENLREFTDYFLHYVGISKEEDSLMRLVVQASRQTTPSPFKETPETFGSRLTDEIILLFFTAEPMGITIVETAQEMEDFGKERRMRSHSNHCRCMKRRSYECWIRATCCQVRQLSIEEPMGVRNGTHRLRLRDWRRYFLADGFRINDGRVYL